MTHRRTFTLGDTMALVAAVALGLTLDRWRATEIAPLPVGASGNGIAASEWLHVLTYGGPSCFVVALAAALVALRWVRPRPSWPRLLRQPGAVACMGIIGTVVANLALLAIGGAVTAATRRADAPLRIYSNWYYWEKVVHQMPMGVIGAWAAQALGGRWFPEGSWIDRAGIALGLYWVAIHLLGAFWVVLARLLPYS